MNILNLETVEKPFRSLHFNLQEKMFQEVANFVRDNSVVQGIAAAIFKGYDVATDLSYNEGHKLLHVAIPHIDDKGKKRGGDEIIPEHHPSLLFNAAREIEGKELYLTVNPSGRHGGAWWDDHNWHLDIKGPTCLDDIIRFLKDADLKRDFF